MDPHDDPNRAPRQSVAEQQVERSQIAALSGLRIWEKILGCDARTEIIRGHTDRRADRADTLEERAHQRHRASTSRLSRTCSAICPRTSDRRASRAGQADARRRMRARVSASNSVDLILETLLPLQYIPLIIRLIFLFCLVPWTSGCRAQTRLQVQGNVGAWELRGQAIIYGVVA